MSPDFWIGLISYINCDNDEVWSLALHDIVSNTSFLLGFNDHLLGIT